MGAICNGDTGCCCPTGQFCEGFVTGVGGESECKGSLAPPVDNEFITKTRGTRQGSSKYGSRGQKQAFRNFSDKYSNFQIGLSHQARLDCAAEVNYPSCLITETAGEPVCEIDAAPQVSKLYTTCLNIKRKNMMDNICPLPGETHDGYGNCIKVQGQPSPPVCYSDGITEKCHASPVPLRNGVPQVIHAVPQEITTLEATEDWVTKNMIYPIAHIITPKPNPPCKPFTNPPTPLDQCQKDAGLEFKKSTEIVKWVAIGLVAYMLVRK